MGCRWKWWLLWTLGVSLASSAEVSTPPHRAVPVAEETLAPDAPNSTYARCETVDLSPFAAVISAESSDCALRSTYKWASAALPTPSERRSLCDCVKLIQKLQRVAIPRCSLIRDEREISYAQLVRYAFGLCAPSGGVMNTINPNATTIAPNGTAAPATDATPSPTTAMPDTPRPNSINGNKDKQATDTNTSTESKSNSKVGLISAVVGGVVVVVAIGVFTAIKRSQRRREAAKNEPPHAAVAATPMSPLGEPSGAYKALPSSISTPTPVLSARSGQAAQSTPGTTGSTAGRPSSTTHDARTLPTSETAMWDDPVLLAVRVPYDAVFFGPLLSHGGYGEVYKGTYRGETVAIKQLLPARRKDLTQIDVFLSEIKLMSTLEHERIVRFIGVAWNALSDACAIVEYMENGDLRSVLSRWDRDEHRPQGFDTDKVKIALHVAHALTYLHSLQPVLVHRDLKSKNILLDAKYDAKLTDFGVSRERADSTMTGGVGTSLWMAPEVMLGERYDEKADVFSFGVVLSELDTQKMPYADAREANTGQQLPDSAILQMVALGRLQISFSEQAHPDLVELGRDCVDLEAKKRPTSAEVLHRVHKVLQSLQASDTA